MDKLLAPPYPGPPLGVYQAQPAVIQAPPVVVQAPPTVVQAPPTVIQAPPVVVQAPPTIVQAPPVVVQAPPTVVQAQPVVVHAQPVITSVAMMPQLQDVPGHITCPQCGRSGITRVNYKCGVLTWVICGVLGIFGIWPCCLIPFCVPSCKDAEHTCPCCNAVLHIHKRM
ncbi:lipopolysaccharide-induced tumor necrosis factor-alpha factor homolog isoform X1 [Takifugu rubripes]|uniref:Lipopolysaccharide-induced tumor necrosis factor-alpha factor homolog n=1 Tax=Takifugu rubripes TaxID=31033 RepID=A0A674NW86_TAKRU|nr:lipopolysaccharide-induced tumor necrosis factor-alpha factor homolog isoform X1 [Takifugu rubripes]